MTVDLVRDMIIGTDFHRGVGVIGEVAGQALETTGNMMFTKLNSSSSFMMIKKKACLCYKQTSQV